MFYFAEAGVWKAIRQFQRKTTFGQKGLCQGASALPFVQPHHPFSFPSLRTISTGAIFRPIIFADLVNMSCYQWCGLTWLLKEMVKWVVFGSAWRASWQWPLEGAVRIPPPRSTQTPKHWGKVMLVTVLGTGGCAGWLSRWRLFETGTTFFVCCAC